MSSLFRAARLACLARGILVGGILAGGLLASPGPAMAGDLTVNVGPDKTRAAGVLMVALFAAAAGWTAIEQAHALVRVEPDAGSGAVVLRDLPPGRYALMAFVDANGNGELDRDADGNPLEPHGFSGGGSGEGPPSFDEALIEIYEDGTSTSITLREPPAPAE
ncbi:DUF2141 domain-containing protein [Marinibaculum pumilum]|uniref:DUF2141 domain-containing protein n=1 Tax=Marinibaculum pumilum TaxID=1766165 RepID=A0ABV7L0H9_9PROT